MHDGVISHLHILFIPGQARDNRETADFISSTDVPVTLHAPYHVHGVNPCEEWTFQAPAWFGKGSFTDYAMAETLEAADRLDAPLVVVHAGTFTTGTPDSAIERFSTFTDRWSDPRFVLENLPVTFRGARMLGNTVAELAVLTSGTQFGICLDFSHLYCSSVSLILPFEDMLSGFGHLPVKYHHLTKSGPGGEKDEHRGLDDPHGELPLKEVFRWIRARPDVPTTLEYKKGGAYNRRQAEIFTALLQGA